jgi:four helix bundle protein
MLKNLRTYDLAVRFYQATRSRRLPNGLTAQFGRAASSVALNLNEGWGRRTNADRLQFFHIALGSIRECQAIVALEQQAFTAEEIDLLDHLAAATYRLVKHQRG